METNETMKVSSGESRVNINSDRTESNNCTESVHPPRNCIRSWIRYRFYEWGFHIQKNCGKVLFLGLLILITLSVALKSVTIETNIEKLWIEVDGRLEKELNYIKSTLGDGIGNSHQLVIQTPSDPGANILHPSSLLYHLEVMKVASQVSVDLFEVTWKLKDICYSPSIPSFEEHYIEKIVSNLFPCAIMTPLDCFWEGSKLLGPDYPIIAPGLPINFKWTSLNPRSLVQGIQKQWSSESAQSSFPFSFLLDIMDRAGITTAYQEKPCLDPNDSECPTGAPNHNSKSAPDVGAELTGGCYGFATKLMHWPEDLIVGGVKKNRTGHITKASALQSVIQMMGDQELFDFWSDDYKVHNIDWNVEKAKLVLEAWQRKLNQEVLKATGLKSKNGLISDSINTKSSGQSMGERLEDLIEEEEVIIPNSRSHSISLYTSTLLSDIMKNFSSTNYNHVTIAYILTIIYSMTVLYQPKSSITSQSFLGLSGICLLVLSTIAGLGICSLIGSPFNSLTTSIVPFLSLGLSTFSLFQLIHTYKVTIIKYKSKIDIELMTGQVLSDVGPGIVLSSTCSVLGFLSAAIIPIPALRSFAIQSAILIGFNNVSLLLIFPAIASLDLRRIRSKNVDLIFCMKAGPESVQAFEDEMDNEVLSDQEIEDGGNERLYHQRMNDLSEEEDEDDEFDNKIDNHVRASQLNNRVSCPIHSNQGINQGIGVSMISSGSSPARINKKGRNQKLLSSLNEPFINNATKIGLNQLNNVNICNCNKVTNLVVQNQTRSRRRTTTGLKSKLTIKYFVRQFYGPFLEKKSIKILIMSIFISSIIYTSTGIAKVKDGLDLSDIVPRGTIEHTFLDVQSKYFNFYNMFAVTLGNFDYPSNQKLLLEYHSSFNRIKTIIKNDDGGLPEFWLISFRDWLSHLQSCFDKDFQEGKITPENWQSNASDEGILAYKLLVQTGRNDYPIDKSQVFKTKLVDNGIINPKAFYVYLTAWASIDSLAYGSSGANLKPEPRQWEHIARDFELKIPKSQPLTYAQMPFYLTKMETTEQIVEIITEIRTICEKFEERGLPNFPAGIPFTFWEQYVRLRFYLVSSLLVVLAVVWLSITLFLMNPWTSALITTLLLAIVAHLYGLMGLLDIKLSAVPAVILILGVGIGTQFFVRIALNFIAASGKKDQRMKLALEQSLGSGLHAAIAITICIGILAFSRFDFIIRYFFCVLLALVIIGSFYGLLLFPVLLSMIGPETEILIDIDYDPRRASIPSSPSTSPVVSRTRSSSSGRQSRNEHRSRSDNHVNEPSASNYFNRNYPRVHSDISLSTISEEPGSIHCFPSSQSIFVQPQVVVETTTTTQPMYPGYPCQQQSRTTSPVNGPNVESPILVSDTEGVPESPLSRESPMSDSSSGASSMSRPNSAPGTSLHGMYPGYHPQTVTTKVTATAKIKLDLHRPSSSSSREDKDDRPSTSRDRRYKDQYHPSRSGRKNPRQ